MRNERTIREMARQARRDEVLWRLHQISPTHVYRMLIAYERVHRKHDNGWARRSFREIFSAAPPRVSTESLPDFLIIEEWIAFK